MFFDIYPDPLIKDQDFKTLCLTAHSSGHELCPWHGKSSSTPHSLTLPKEKTTKIYIGLSLEAYYTCYLLIHSWILASLCYF